jgi:enterochelin esterase-like enzyme
MLPFRSANGQNLFDTRTSIFGNDEWRVDETVSSLIEQGSIPPLIVVGVDNGGRRLRPKEYLPWVDKTLQPPVPDPQGSLYPRFLLDEVVPYVENRYRTLSGAERRVLGGSSYGAGIALYTLIRRPGSFDGLLLESPSIYTDDYHLLKDAALMREWRRRVYVGTGTVREPIDDVGRLETMFRKAGLDQHRLKVVVQTGGEHSEKWWAKRLPTALKFLFPPSRP